MNAAALAGDPLLADALDHARRHGLVLVTDGRDLMYTPAHFIPPGFLRFGVVRRAPPANDAEPRA